MIKTKIRIKIINLPDFNESNSFPNPFVFLCVNFVSFVVKQAFF